MNRYKCYKCDFELNNNETCACPRCGWMMRLKEVVGSENEKRVRKEVENTLAALYGGSNSFLLQLERKALEKLEE